MRLPLLGSALLCLALGLSACGSGSSSTSSTGQITPEEERAAAKAAQLRRRAEARAPKGASPTLRAIYANFPPPKPDPEVRRSAAAIAAGKRACEGKTPLQVREEFYAAARARLSAEQKKMIARIDSYERGSSKDASFAVGQLAADVYEATLPKAIAQYGYEGCVYSLARDLEQRLAPAAGGR